MKNNFMIVISSDGKVTNLYYSRWLEDLGTIKAMHRSSTIEIIRLHDDGATQQVTAPVYEKYLSRNGKPFANSVLCVETGEIFSSVAECSKKMRIPQVNIYKAIRQNICASRYHFEYVGKCDEGR